MRPPLKFFFLENIAQVRALADLAEILATVYVHPFYAYHENCRFTSGQITEILRHAGRHVRSKPADCAIYCIWVSFIAFWSAMLHCSQHKWC